MSPQTIAHYRITAKLCEVAMSAARYPDIGSLVLEVFAGFDGSSFRVVIRHRQASDNSTWQLEALHAGIHEGISWGPSVKPLYVTSANGRPIQI